MIVRLGVIVVALTAGLLLLTACDEAHSFVFANKTGTEITLTFTVTEEKDPGALGGGTYVLAPEQTVDSSVDPFQTNRGEAHGDSIFYRGLVLLVRATAGGTVLLDRVFTYDELKEAGFRVEIEEP